MTVCTQCDDTHQVTIRYDGREDRTQMCTSCPTPCEKCRQDGNGPFCETTPCPCACHHCETCGAWKGLDKTKGECGATWGMAHGRKGLIQRLVDSKKKDNDMDGQKDDATPLTFKNAVEMRLWEKTYALMCAEGQGTEAALQASDAGVLAMRARMTGMGREDLRG